MTTPAASAGSRDYGRVLSRTSDEYQRLRQQARLWEQVTARVISQVGIGAGMRCLDAGCGSGDVMRLMAGLVGHSGHVTGIDNDAQLGGEALHILRATVPGQFEFVHANVEAADEVPGGPFDLVYARLLLFHVRDPVAMVRKLYAWTRPGGVMLVQDYDCRAMDILPRLATWEEFERVFHAVFEKVGADPRVGQRLPLHFAAAGLGQPDGTDVAGLLVPLREIGGMFRTLYQSVWPAGLRLGLTTEAAGEAFTAELTEAIGRPDGVAMTPLLVTAWKHKPLAPGS